MSQKTTIRNGSSVHISHQQAKLWQWRIIFIGSFQSCERNIYVNLSQYPKGKVYLCSDEKGKEISIYGAPPRCLHCAECLVYITISVNPQLYCLDLLSPSCLLPLLPIPVCLLSTTIHQNNYCQGL